MSKKKVILAVVLPVTITIVFAWANLTLPLREAIGVCVAAFVGGLVGYVWKRDNPTFGGMIFAALVVAGVAAAMLVISNLLASYVF